MQAEGVQVLVSDVRQAALRIARNCNAGRPDDVPCPVDCPGLTACRLGGGVAENRRPQTENRLSNG